MDPQRGENNHPEAPKNHKRMRPLFGGQKGSDFQGAQKAGAKKKHMKQWEWRADLGIQRHESGKTREHQQAQDDAGCHAGFAPRLVGLEGGDGLVVGQEPGFPGLGPAMGLGRPPKRRSREA